MRSLLAGDEDRRVFLYRRVDRERFRRSRDVCVQVDQVEATGESRLPAGGCALRAASRDCIIADEILFAYERILGGIQRRRCRADLLAIALDDVIEGGGLHPQRDFGETLGLGPVTRT